MAKYKIIAQEVTGVKGSRYFKNAIVEGSVFVEGSIEQLVNAKAISLVEEKKPEPKEK